MAETKERRRKISIRRASSLPWEGAVEHVRGADWFDEVPLFGLIRLIAIIWRMGVCDVISTTNMTTKLLVWMGVGDVIYTTRTTTK